MADDDGDDLEAELDDYIEGQGFQVAALRQQPLGDAPWPAQENPMLAYLIDAATRAYENGPTKGNLESVLTWLAAHAWFEGALDRTADIAATADEELLTTDRRTPHSTSAFEQFLSIAAAMAKDAGGDDHGPSGLAEARLDDWTVKDDGHVHMHLSSAGLLAGAYLLGVPVHGTGVVTLERMQDYLPLGAEHAHLRLHLNAGAELGHEGCVVSAVCVECHGDLVDALTTGPAAGTISVHVDADDAVAGQMLNALGWSTNGPPSATFTVHDPQGCRRSVLSARAMLHREAGPGLLP